MPTIGGILKKGLKESKPGLWGMHQFFHIRDDQALEVKANRDCICLPFHGNADTENSNCDAHRIGELIVRK